MSDLAYPTPDQIRDGILRAVSYAYQRRGLLANVLPGSEHYQRADAYAGQVAIAIANNQLSATDSDPLTAQGQGLLNLAAVFGVTARRAAAAAGTVNITFTGTTVTIPAGYTLSSPDGHVYQTAGAGTYAQGVPVDIIATVGGASTNQGAGTQLVWSSAAIGILSPTAVVTSAGLTGGIDADTVEVVRARLLQRLSAPPVGGNWSAVAAWAEQASASVGDAYVFSGIEGAASYDVALVAAGSPPTLPSAIVATVKSYILARMPGLAQLNVTSVTQQGVDVTLIAVLALPQGAGGASDGWDDQAAWPAEDAKVTAYNAGTGTATCNAVNGPSVGSSIGIWSAASATMHTYSVATVGGSSGAWTFTVQGGFLVSPLGAYISAGALNLIAYATAFAAQMAALGPGEKTALPELLPRAARQPAPDASTPANLTARLTDAVLNAYDELDDLNYSLRVATGTSTPLTGPSVSATTADPPNVLVLQQFAIHA